MDSFRSSNNLTLNIDNKSKFKRKGTTSFHPMQSASRAGLTPRSVASGGSNLREPNSACLNKNLSQSSKLKDLLADQINDDKDITKNNDNNNSNNYNNDSF